MIVSSPHSEIITEKNVGSERGGEGEEPANALSGAHRFYDAYG